MFQPRQNLLTAASKVGEASHDLMKRVGDDNEELDKAFQVGGATSSTRLASYFSSHSDTL